ncbi:hypothetical protein SAMN04489860_0577 [Paraoerskovia marina]|uniref:Uncharacterized protein n=1 Tax=Paraoerskovia marina TaxID=545619 RepID=A0A1H1NNA9_9CELL|nr:hypothetical protein [Paraoerskovia marina]SDS00373.1 hypothetical protein SAMN04489860_0577 [Paraoerskovia marina]
MASATTLPLAGTRTPEATAAVFPVTPGYGFTPTQRAALDATPWGWRTGVVRSVSERLTCVGYDADVLPAAPSGPTGLGEPAPVPNRAILWHAADLRAALHVGDLVAVHEEHHALRYVVDDAHDAIRTVSAFVECGVGPAPRPATT